MSTPPRTISITNCLLVVLTSIAAISLGLLGPTAARADTTSPETRVPAAPTIACDKGGDTPQKGWIQVAYVHRPGQDGYANNVESIRRIMWDVDQIFDASARRFGQGDSRRLRFVQDSSCRIKVLDLTLGNLPDPHSYTIAQSAGPAMKVVDDQVRASQVAKGLSSDRADQAVGDYNGRHKFALFLDLGDSGDCGLGGGANTGTLGGGWGAVTLGCWGAAAMSHELGHAFGLNHCNDDHANGDDPMCRGYDPSRHCNGMLSEIVYDCVGDDFHYFDPHPAADNPLAKNPAANMANSPYLLRTQPTPPVDGLLVNQKTHLCLGAKASAVVQQACTGGTRPVWRRTITDTGYLSLEYLPTRTCLTMPSTTVPQNGQQSAEVGATLSPCAPNSPTQHWWMEDAFGPSHGDYQLKSGSTEQAIQVKDNSTKAGTPVVQPGGGDAATFQLVLTDNTAPSRNDHAHGKEPTTYPSPAGHPVRTFSPDSKTSQQLQARPSSATHTQSDLAKTGSDSSMTRNVSIAGAVLLLAGIAAIARTPAARRRPRRRH